jgi:uncharacterized protein
MSANEQQANNNSVTEQMVRDYLMQNGDFLQRNPDLLDHLYIDHASGSAVSLVEKQVSVLRERNIDMRRRLSSLTSHARENDDLHRQTSQLILDLLDSQSLGELFEAFTHTLTEGFGVEYASMILYGEPEASGEFCRFEDQEMARVKVGALLRGGKPMCGALRAEELEYLFPNSTGEGSAALLPLMSDGEIGLIAIGSSNANHYSGDMDTLFLSHIADVVARLVSRVTQQQVA